MVNFSVTGGGGIGPLGLRLRGTRRKGRAFERWCRPSGLPLHTRPIEREGRTIPEVLRSGDHAKIAAWRKAMSESDTRLRRPDLWERHEGARDRPASGARREKKDQGK
jgi:hypothetical protein